jgi:hypothetical protein
MREQPFSGCERFAQPIEYGQYTLDHVQPAFATAIRQPFPQLNQFTLAVSIGITQMLQDRIDMLLLRFGQGIGLELFLPGTGEFLLQPFYRPTRLLQGCLVLRLRTRKVSYDRVQFDQMGNHIRRDGPVLQLADKK